MANTVGSGLLEIEDRSDLVARDTVGEVDTTWSRWWQSFLRGAALPQDDGLPLLRCVDLFCGAGGFALGATLAARNTKNLAHFERIVDTDADALEVFAHRLSVGKSLNTGVSSIVDYRVRRRNGIASFAYEPEIVDPSFNVESNIDLLIAGPPCQGHSNLNNHTRRDDPRNDLLICAAATAVAIDVKAAVFENVKSITASKNGITQLASDLFRSRGYDIQERVVRAPDLGWPQTRERYFLIAIREDLSPKRIPSFTSFKTESPESVLWAIHDLQNSQSENGEFDSAPKSGKVSRRRIDWLFNNNEFNLPNSERPDCHKNGTTYTAVYGRMYKDRPAPTITTGISTPGQGRFIHPLQRRLITPHEAARIQGFPDGFGLSASHGKYTRKQLTKWIGDAVPSPMGYEVISWVLIAMGLQSPNSELLRAKDDGGLELR